MHKPKRPLNVNKFIQEQIKEIKKTVGKGKVLLALSGGVDSSVCAALISRAIGKQLTCVFVNTGLMRYKEPEQVKKTFSKFNLNFKVIEAEKLFLEKLKGVTDPEKKRKIIGELYIRIFEKEAKKIGKVDFLGQGTIYPDITESGKGKNKFVKSHHNVGGLPDVIDFKGLIEPVKYLYKQEVRDVGKALNLPKEIYTRQPFPGPGLGVRVIGELTKQRLDTLRLADYIWRSEIEKAHLNKDISQYFAILLATKSVGLANQGARAYGYTIGLRAIKTKDFCTASWVKIPYEVVEKVSNRIVKEVKGVNRIVLDVTHKPPGTIEWE